MDRNKTDLILVTGVVGMIGALLGTASDLILLGRPVSGWESLQAGALDNTIYIADWRLPVGSILGCMAIPVAIVGFWHLLYALKPAGSRIAWPPFLFMAHMLIVGAAFHASYMFVGTGLKVDHTLVLEGGAGLPQMADRLMSYSMILMAIAALELVIGSILFILATLRHRTFYPRWMAVANPAVCGGFLYLIALFLPAPVGGYIGVVGFNFGVFVFLAISTLVLRRSGGQHNE